MNMNRRMRRALAGVKRQATLDKWGMLDVQWAIRAKWEWLMVHSQCRRDKFEGENPLMLAIDRYNYNRNLEIEFDKQVNMT
jgi:hypothetical protein